MKKFRLKEVVTGIYGVTPYPVTRVLAVKASTWDGAAKMGVDPDTGELYAVSQLDITHEGGHAGRWVYENAAGGPFDVDAHYTGMKVPVMSKEDQTGVDEAIAWFRVYRRRLEDVLRKTFHARLAAELGKLLAVY